jgi:hypothetical protein
MLKLGISYPDLIKFHYFVDTKQNENSLSSPTTTKQIDLATCQEQLAKTNQISSHIGGIGYLLTQPQLISFTYDTCTSFQHPTAVHHAGWMMMVLYVSPAKHLFFSLHSCHIANHSG